MKVLKKSKINCEAEKSTRYNQLGEFERIPSWLQKITEGDDLFTPTAHVNEYESEFELKIELAGLIKPSLKTEVSGKLLFLSGQRKIDKVESFVLKYRLSHKCDESSMILNYQDGLLTIFINKKIADKRKKISLSDFFKSINIFSAEEMSTDPKAS